MLEVGRQKLMLVSSLVSQSLVIVISFMFHLFEPDVSFCCLPKILSVSLFCSYTSFAVAHIYQKKLHIICQYLILEKEQLTSISICSCNYCLDVYQQILLEPTRKHYSFVFNFTSHKNVKTIYFVLPIPLPKSTRFSDGNNKSKSFAEQAISM